MQAHARHIAEQFEKADKSNVGEKSAVITLYDTRKEAEGKAVAAMNILAELEFHYRCRLWC